MINLMCIWLRSTKKASWTAPLSKCLNNIISVIKDNTFNNLPSVTTLSHIEYNFSIKPIYQYNTYNS